MTITSTAVGADQHILPQYTCDGRNINPPLTFSEVPVEAKSLALILDDPDAPGGTFTHWTLYDMSAAALQILENSQPPSGRSGQNSFGETGYGGPCPPSGTHHYHFKLLALDNTIDLAAGVTISELRRAIEVHVIDSAELVALYARQ